MNQFFEGLANQNNAEVSSTDVKDNSTLRAGGKMTINKGMISMDINYWADVYKSRYIGFASIDDMDYEQGHTYINGIKIDSISKFNEGLNNMGLSSISEQLKITNDEINNEICKAINDSYSFKHVYSDLELFESLDKEKQKDVILDYAIGNYDKIDSWTLHRYGLIDKDSPKPTLEELIKIKSGK
jgi:hypothetical protein